MNLTKVPKYMRPKLIKEKVEQFNIVFTDLIALSVHDKVKQAKNQLIQI